MQNKDLCLLGLDIQDLIPPPNPLPSARLLSDPNHQPTAHLKYVHESLKTIDESRFVNKSFGKNKKIKENDDPDINYQHDTLATSKMNSLECV